MRFFFLFSTLFLSMSIYSQKKEYDQKVYMYKTFADFKADKGLFVGNLSWYSGDKMNPNKIYLLDKDNKEFKLELDDYWGFKVDEFVFRNKTEGYKLALSIVTIKEKVLYANAYVMLNLVRFGKTEGSSQTSLKQFFYSDSIDSEIYELTKMPKKEKDNPALQDLIKCIERGNKRHGDQSKLNTYSECVMNY